ncbi:MAG TPA: zinc ribbon domain-containing protein [Stenotrophobium sp.]|nr:zinc ribbon domain-containing protein [Stenotrophobium sp.]
MPIYDYYCQACGQQSEIMHKISDPPATKCPHCGKPALTKQVSAAGFRLKGGGWYETDFKSGNKRNLASDSSEAKPETKTQDTAKSSPAAAPAGASDASAAS